MKQIFLTIFVLTLFVQCTPEKRLARLLSKHPKLIKKDTIFKTDTTIVNGVTTDTLFRTQITKDTLIIRDKQLEIRYYNDGKTTYIKGKCDTIFVIKEIPIQINSVQPKVLSRKEKFKLFLFDNLAEILIIIVIVYYLLRRFGKLQI